MVTNVVMGMYYMRMGVRMLSNLFSKLDCFDGNVCTVIDCETCDCNKHQSSCRTCAIVSAGQVGKSIVIFHGMYNFIDKSAEPHSQVGANQMHETETNDGQLLLAIVLQVIIKK